MSEVAPEQPVEAAPVAQPEAAPVEATPVVAQVPSSQQEPVAPAVEEVPAEPRSFEDKVRSLVALVEARVLLGARELDEVLAEVKAHL